MQRNKVTIFFGKYRPLKAYLSYLLLFLSLIYEWTYGKEFIFHFNLFDHFLRLSDDEHELFDNEYSTNVNVFRFIKNTNNYCFHKKSKYLPKSPSIRYQTITYIITFYNALIVPLGHITLAIPRLVCYQCRQR